MALLLLAESNKTFKKGKGKGKKGKARQQQQQLQQQQQAAAGDDGAGATGAAVARLELLVHTFVCECDPGTARRCVSAAHKGVQVAWLGLGILAAPAPVADAFPAHGSATRGRHPPSRAAAAGATQPGPASALAGADLFAALPDELVAQVLSHVASYRDLCALSRACRRLWSAARTDVMWEPLFRARGWDKAATDAVAAQEGPARGVAWRGWKHAYGQIHQLLCYSCRAPTRYWFPLLACRLCEKCQRQKKAYRLCTRAAATERCARVHVRVRARPGHRHLLAPPPPPPPLRTRVCAPASRRSSSTA